MNTALENLLALEVNLDCVKNQPLISHPNIWIKREDLIHPAVSGNKFRKLLYNIDYAKRINADALVTFGGAYSNHIAATAAAGKLCNIKTIGIIRGEELNTEQAIYQNPTLRFAAENNMQFYFVDRETYRARTNQDYLNQLAKIVGKHFAISNPSFIPEGGTNRLAIKGCETILCAEDDHFDVIACAVGTGGTISGLIRSAQPHQKVLGFPALKGEFLQDSIQALLQFDLNMHIDLSMDMKNQSSTFCSQYRLAEWQLIHDYHFGGYAKVTDELVSFINQFYMINQILLDPIYTAKLMFGVIDMLEKGLLSKHQKILVIHTGGLQGIAGINQQLRHKQRTLINISNAMLNFY